MTIRPFARVLAGFAAFLAGVAVSDNVAAQSARGLEASAAAVIEHWTPERRAAAIPRDLVIDQRGLGYLRGPGNALTPYGHDIAAQAGPGGGSDVTGPTISNMSPAANTTVGASATFQATVADASGVKSVTVRVQPNGGIAQSFSAGKGANDLWSVNLSGLTDGDWSWSIVAKDATKGAGNVTTTPAVAFHVTVGGGGPPPPPPPGGVPEAQWTNGGVVQGAAGRIYFEMPANAKRKGPWTGYVCSGTVVDDATSGRSVILTASHCVYDDANKAFAKNVLFIPDQSHTTGTGTDRNCANDPIGCWAPSLGVVDVNWTLGTFPNNVAWDYAFYVVKDSGAHTAGFGGGVEGLDAAVVAMAISFAAPSITAGSNLTHALGYSYSLDPMFRYCADGMTQESSGTVNWWLGNCGLTGGASGGPWVQPMDMTPGVGNGPIISVNSWGYTNQPGMAGPKLSGTSASCVFGNAKSVGIGTYADGEAGLKANCP